MDVILDEWNMSLGEPPLDRRFRACFAAKVAWQMIDAGLDYSCYNYIRDWHVSAETFAKFMSPQEIAW